MKQFVVCWLSIADVAPARAQDVVCDGSDRWSIKTTADTSQAAINAATKVQPKTVDEILGTQRPAWQKPKTQYQKKQIPGEEGKTVRVRGWLYQIGHDPHDSDYHCS